MQALYYHSLQQYNVSGTDLFVVLAVVSAVFKTKIFLKFGLY